MDNVRMTKDYAKHPSKSKPSPFAEKVKLIFVYTMSLLFLSGLGVTIYWFGTHKALFFNLKKSLYSWDTKIKSFFPSRNHDRPLLASLPKNEEIALRTPVRFEFYSELPREHKAEVTKNTLPPTIIASSLKNRPPKKTTIRNVRAIEYKLHIATFGELTAASQFRLSLLLAGIDAKVVKQNKHHQVFYHIEQGPYPNLKLAQSNQKKLLYKGFESKIIKL